MTVSAVIVGHGSRPELISMMKQLKVQTKPPDEIIIVACCTDATGLGADTVVSDTHRGDWGHVARDMGLKLAKMDRVGFFNSDDEYVPEYIERMTAYPEDLVMCDFKDGGHIVEAHASLGSVTAGNFLVNRELAQSIGWNHRDYLGDGKFINDITSTGCSWIRCPEVLYIHN